MSRGYPVYITSLLAFLAGALLVYVATSAYGIGLTPDSVSYLAAAKNLKHGHGLIDYDGTPFIKWPPVYPCALYSISALGLGEQLAARVLNVIVYDQIIAMLSAWLRSSMFPVS